MVILHYNPKIGDIAITDKKDETHFGLLIKPNYGKPYHVVGELTDKTLSTIFGNFELSTEDISNITNFYQNI